MATKEQYEFFKSLFDEENIRRTCLRERADKNMSLTTMYSAFVLFTVEKLRPDSQFSKRVFVAIIICMLLCFLLSLWSSRIQRYERVNDPNELINQFSKTQMDDREFFMNRIADYTVSSLENSKVNDKSARCLEFANYLLALAIFLQGVYFCIMTKMFAF